ncbi:MAG: radical SAM protein, partial [Bacilli bacterium]|nr:radical SAM protein [Bacilli bacterium]
MNEDFLNFYKTTKHFNIIVTNKCNRNCPFCIAKKNSNNGNYTYIAMENIENAMSFIKTENIETIALPGGEPTLHPNIIEIAKKIKQTNCQLALYTNYDFKDKVEDLDGLI